jgi:hypothetical protein
MPPTFIQVGAVWINLSVVTSVELQESPDVQGKPIGARVNYTSGKFQTFEEPTDIQELAAWLRAHKAK